ncbi:MAG: TIGR00153 family protein [Deltaproteobacteria bacterium]|nr:TIGR00153 family protein [Deltaproteobacteria bacterium]MBW2386076.1 TIGR00153 family protein [Deltaproteobacteria bacterium]
MSLIGNLFGRSPVRPMQEHMKAAVACVRVVQPLVEAMVAGDHAAVAERRAEIDHLEHEADAIKNDIRSHMPRRFMMAMERRDMLEILDCQDSIADTAQDIAELADLRGMQVPPPMADPLLVLVRSVIAACEQGQRVINELDELVETGFGAREVGRVEEMIGELNRIESETDEHAHAVLRVLFSLEAELGVGTYFWYRLVIWTADLADYAERVGNRLRLLIAQ